MVDFQRWIDSAEKSPSISEIPTEIVKIINEKPKETLQHAIRAMGSKWKDFAYLYLTHPDLDPSVLDRDVDYSYNDYLFDGLISHPNPNIILLRKFAYRKDVRFSKKYAYYLCDKVTRWMRDQKFVDLDIIQHFINRTDYVGESKQNIAELVIIGDIDIMQKVKFLQALTTESSQIRARVAEVLLRQSNLPPGLQEILEILRRSTDDAVMRIFLQYMIDNHQFDSSRLKFYLVTTNNEVLLLLTSLISQQETFPRLLVQGLLRQVSILPEVRKYDGTRVKIMLAEWIRQKLFPISKDLRDITLDLLRDPDISVRRPIGQWLVSLNKISAPYIEILRNDTDREIQNWATLVEPIAEGQDQAIEHGKHISETLSTQTSEWPAPTTEASSQVESSENDIVLPQTVQALEETKKQDTLEELERIEILRNLVDMSQEILLDNLSAVLKMPLPDLLRYLPRWKNLGLVLKGDRVIVANKDGFLKELNAQLHAPSKIMLKCPACREMVQMNPENMKCPRCNAAWKIE